MKVWRDSSSIPSSIPLLRFFSRNNAKFVKYILNFPALRKIFPYYPYERRGRKIPEITQKRKGVVKVIYFLFFRGFGGILSNYLKEFRFRKNLLHKHTKNRVEARENDDNNFTING